MYKMYNGALAIYNEVARYTKYDKYDADKILSFLTQKQRDGRMNGEVLIKNFNPNDRSTWIEFQGFKWDDDDRLVGVNLQGDYPATTGCLDLSGCTALKEISVGKNRLDDIIVDGCTSFRYLRCKKNDLKNLSLAGCESLLAIECDVNKIEHLDMRDCRRLYRLTCSYNQIKDLDLSRCNSLTYLDATYNTLTYVNVRGCENLSPDKSHLSHNGELTYLGSQIYGLR